MTTSEQYHIYKQLEPNDKLHSSRPVKTTKAIFDQWQWIDSLSDEQRKHMADEYEQERTKQQQ